MSTVKSASLTLALIGLVIGVFALGVIAAASYIEWRSQFPNEVWVDCPDGLAIVWWDSDAPWPTLEDHPAICAGLDRIHQSMMPTQIAGWEGVTVNGRE